MALEGFLVFWCVFFSFFSFFNGSHVVLFLFFRDQYLFKQRHGETPKDHKFYRLLYPQIIQDIEVGTQAGFCGDMLLHLAQHNTEVVPSPTL